MHQSTRPPVRRAAVIGAVVAATAIGSVVGLGTPATAATPATTAAPTTATTPGSPAPTGVRSTDTTAPATAATAAATPGDGSDLAFTEPSTRTAPLALSGTVGTPFSHTFTTTGGNGTVAYAIQDAPSPDYTVNVETGVLSGTPTTAGTSDFEVVALSGSTQVTEYVRLTVAPSPVVFTEPSSAAEPLALTATAGSTFTHTFRTTGGSGPLAYAIQDSPSKGLSVNVETGVLTSTVTTAGTYDFEVVALRGTATATAHVRLTVRPAAPVGVLAIVGSGTPGTTVWSVAPGGVVTAFDGGGRSLGRVSSIPTRQGGSLVVSGLAVDRFGNATAPGSASGGSRATVTSSVASDRIDGHQADAVRVTFPHASDHRLTVTQDGVSTSFVVAVRPVATAAVATTATTRTPGGTLAYTGADETTPLAWAFGLLAAGGGLLVHRWRRRRA